MVSEIKLVEIAYVSKSWQVGKPDKFVPVPTSSVPLLHSSGCRDSEGLTLIGLRLMDLVFGLLLVTTEPRTGGRATAGEDYVAVGIENLDC